MYRPGRDAGFADRRDAGRRLARRLLPLKDEQPVVLALPRGGVPVAFEIARALGAPLDLILVRKIGAPFQPELAIGAVVDGDAPEMLVDEEIVRELRIPDRYLEEERTRQLAEIERRRGLYLGGRHRVPLAGRTAIVVDDGIATGSTMRAALGAARRAGPRRLVVAAGVAPAASITELKGAADEVVCLLTPDLFAAVGDFYEDFHQVADAEVVDYLQRAGSG